MEYQFDSMLGLNGLNLYYEAHLAGIEGECFDYSVYFENGVTDEKISEISKAINEFTAPFDEKGIYPGYMSVSKEAEKAMVYLDLGNVNPNYENTVIRGILTAFNNVSGIKKVIINEWCDDEF